MTGNKDKELHKHLDRFLAFNLVFKYYQLQKYLNEQIPASFYLFQFVCGDSLTKWNNFQL